MNQIDIEKQFHNKGILRGGILLLKAPDALEFVMRCRDNSIKILGIDAFIIANDKTQPLLEHSIDFSAFLGGSKISVFNEASEFLNERMNSDLYFEIVVDL